MVHMKTFRVGFAILVLFVISEIDAVTRVARSPKFGGQSASSQASAQAGAFGGGQFNSPPHPRFAGNHFGGGGFGGRPGLGRPGGIGGLGGLGGQRGSGGAISISKSISISRGGQGTAQSSSNAGAGTVGK